MGNLAAEISSASSQIIDLFQDLVLKKFTPQYPCAILVTNSSTERLETAFFPLAKKKKAMQDLASFFILNDTVIGSPREA